MRSIRERNPIVVAIVGVVLLAAIGTLAYFSDDLPIIGGGTGYTADFTEAAGLRPGDEVRVAGVLVGHVSRVGLAGDHVTVEFKVKNTWVGNASTVAIKIKTLLGAKYLAVDPLGTGAQNPDQPIPASRTVSPYDVTEAFNGLGNTVGQLNTDQLAQSFESVAGAFDNTAPSIRAALDGLSALSRTISSRDTELAQLLANTNQVTGDLSAEDTEFQTLINDGNLLLAELQRRSNAIGALLTGAQQLATQLAGLVADDNASLGPALAQLDQVTDVLRRNQNNLNQALAIAGPYYRLVGNALGNGRWLDSYLCGLIPPSYLPPGTGPASGCQPPKGGR